MPKAKRRITDFDFESQGGSVHLVSKKQGGAANGFTTLIKKSKSTASLPDIEDLGIEKKLEQIKVTMSMEEFLQKFFSMWSDDAELLTAMLGFKTEYEDFVESLEEESPEPMTYADYIASKLSSFEIMKSMYEGNLSDVTAMDYVNVLELQEKLENKLNEEMMDKVSIEKSRLSQLEEAEGKLESQVDITKSLEAKVEELTNELDTIKKAQADKELEVMKSRLEGLVADEKIERMAKSLMAMDEEAAQDMIDTLTASHTKIEESDLMVEKSAEGEPEVKSDKEEREARMQKALNAAYGIKE